MKLSLACGCCRSSKAKKRHNATDTPINATAEELALIKAQLLEIEESLSRLWGAPIWSRTPEGLELRAEAADLIDRHFAGIVEQWTDTILMMFPAWYSSEEQVAKLKINMFNALIRMVDHLRDPEDLGTYVHLRRHCQEGMIARAKPSQFNTIHIALKQVILKHVKSTMTGRRMEQVRDAVVAAIDERRLMVSQFYIEWRERMLRESEEKYRNSVNHAPDPMYEIEPHTWAVLGANSAAEKMHLMMPGEEQMPLVGRPLTDFVPQHMRPDTAKSLEQVLRDGTAQAIDLPLGPYFYDVNMALISYGNKQFIQMILRDVTQRHEMLDSLLKAERLAAAGTFAAGVAHEVNNPLASISSLVQSLLSGEQDEQRRTVMHTILSQITRISSTLKDLVNFARPTTAQRKHVDVNALVSETLRLVTYNKRFSGIRVEPILAPDLRPAFADDNEIQQVLLNLVFNAADASPAEGGVIKVITENHKVGQGSDRSHRIKIRVVDNGIGIPKEHLERVFDPFFTTKPAGAGVGLGLSLCQRMILANHGTIRVDSEVGRGTSVAITLPVHEEAVQTQSAA
ncbi:MAG: ATP-binding protein [Candidatus Binatus sp.]|uniref:two-component system sensor histidine kinase NtrB n=1 Tax=Candidatus Binatus sp. TaxID=2811406 RepID=UPI002727EBDE|nr:ATP-binding protein [Candidatus Binatus sp.]MDO8433957.1 ATP-binding protein [Candidatus Binatus sp.]